MIDLRVKIAMPRSSSVRTRFTWERVGCSRYAIRAGTSEFSSIRSVDDSGLLERPQSEGHAVWDPRTLPATGWPRIIDAPAGGSMSIMSASPWREETHHEATPDFVQESISLAVAAARKAVMNHRTASVRFLWA